MSAMLTSPSAFAPRKEFLKNTNTPHQFALLTFNGAEILRLSNFPPNVINSMRTLFQQQGVYRAYREDSEMGVSEFIMVDRLWTSKSVKTERLVTLIFSVILSHRFKFVTTLAYGRLAQDTRSLVFSKAMPGSFDLPSSSKTNSPAVPASPLPLSSPSLHDGARPEQRTCFALSLTQKTLRVICAPKSSTPAILASVRSAWPRGVVAEGKPEGMEDVYEFQLKGYSLFSTSTFDRDALVHIFGLLRALDTHAFQLITNLNLTQGIAKSRTKDLWIFDCPADPPSPPHSQYSPSPHASLLNVKGKDPERIMSVATATTAGMAGLGAGTNTGYYTSPEGQAHIRAATAPSPLSKEQRVSTDSEAGEVFAAHTRAATSPLPSNLERRPSVLKKPPPGSFVTEKPRRKDSIGSIGSFKSGKEKEREREVQEKPQPVVEPPIMRPDSNPIPPPPPFTPGYSYQSQGTAGPLSESEYAYGYSGVYDMHSPKGNHHDSEYLYKQYVPPPPPPPHPAQGSSGAVIYSTTSPAGKNHSEWPQSPSGEEGLLSSDAFRETAYSGTSEPPATWTGTGTNSVPTSPTDSHTRHVQQGQVTPRTAHVPLPQQPEMSAQYTGMEGRPKSEKALMGIIPPPPPGTYPIPSAVPVPIPPPHDERPGAARTDTAATRLPPGGYPKTPLESSSSSVRIIPVEKSTAQGIVAPRPRHASEGGKVLAGGGAGTVGRSVSKKSERSESPGSKGWVLVNVEPSAMNGGGRKASVDEGARMRTASASAGMGVGVVSDGTITESPVETFGRRPPGPAAVGFDESPLSPVDARTEESGAHSLPLEPDRRKNSLKKKQRSGSSDDSTKKRRFLGLFSKGHKKGASAPGGMMVDERLDERDDAERAVEGVHESTWRKVRDPKAPTPVTKLTIG